MVDNFMHKLKINLIKFYKKMITPDLRPILRYSNSNTNINVDLYNQYNEIVYPTSITPLTYTFSSITVQWFINGVLLPNYSNVFLNMSQLSGCSNDVKVEVSYTINNITVNGQTITHDYVFNDDVENNFVIQNLLIKNIIINSNIYNTIDFADIGFGFELKINGVIANDSTITSQNIFGKLTNGNVADLPSLPSSFLLLSSQLTIDGSLVNYRKIKGDTEPKRIILGLNNNIINYGLIDVVRLTILPSSVFTNYGKVMISPDSLSSGGYFINNGSFFNTEQGIFQFISSTGPFTFTNDSIFSSNLNSVVNITGSGNLVDKMINSSIGNIILADNASMNVSGLHVINTGTINLSNLACLILTPIDFINQNIITCADFSYVVVESPFMNNLSSAVKLFDFSSINISGTTFTNNSTIDISSNCTLNIYNGSNFVSSTVSSSVINNNGVVNLWDISIFTYTSGAVNNMNIFNAFPGSTVSITTLTGNLIIGKNHVTATPPSLLNMAAPNIITGTIVARSTYVSPNVSATELYGAIVGKIPLFNYSNASVNIALYESVVNPFVPNFITATLVASPILPNTDSILMVGNVSSITIGDNLSDSTTVIQQNITLHVSFINSYFATILVQPLTVAPYIVDTEVIIGNNYMIQNSLLTAVPYTVSGTYLLNLFYPVGTTPSGQLSAYNYVIGAVGTFVQNSVVDSDGVYETKFVDSPNNFTYYSILLLTGSIHKPFYIVIEGSDGNIYGVLVGFPSIITFLEFFPHNDLGQVKYKIYRNGLLINTFNKVPTALFKPLDILTVIGTDCCNNMSVARSFEQNCASNSGSH